MEKALARYRTSDSCPLELYFPMEFLQDDKFFSALSEDIDVCGEGWERVSNVSSATYKSLPDSKGIYLFIWRPGFTIECHNDIADFRYVVYVGSAASGDSSILKRFNSDYKNEINNCPSVHWTENMPSDRASRLKKVLNLGKLELWYVTMDEATSEQILDIEKRLINLFNPPGNKTFKAPIRVKLEPTKAAPAFEPAF